MEKVVFLSIQKAKILRNMPIYDRRACSIHLERSKPIFHAHFLALYTNGSRYKAYKLLEQLAL